MIQSMTFSEFRTKQSHSKTSRWNSLDWLCYAGTKLKTECFGFASEQNFWSYTLSSEHVTCQEVIIRYSFLYPETTKCYHSKRSELCSEPETFYTFLSLINCYTCLVHAQTQQCQHQCVRIKQCVSVLAILCLLEHMI